MNGIPVTRLSAVRHASSRYSGRMAVSIPTAAGTPIAATSSMTEERQSEGSERLRDAVCERLTGEGGVHTGDVAVRVVGSEVVLQGSVPSEDERERAGRVARAVPGVGGVVNELELRAGELEPGPDVPFPDERDTRAA